MLPRTHWQLVRLQSGKHQCQISLHVVFSTKLATRLEIIMEITKQALWKLELLKAGTLFQKCLSTDESAKFRLLPLFCKVAK